MEVLEIETLLNLFDERDKLINDINTKIAFTLGPTVFSAIAEIFEQKTEDIDWVNIDLIDDVVVIMLNVAYTVGPTMPLIFKQMEVSIDSSESKERIRTMRIGVPLTLVSKPLETIKQYIIDMTVKKQDTTNMPVASPENKQSVEFDPTDLSEDQLKQLHLFMHAVPGVKQ